MKGRLPKAEGLERENLIKQARELLKARNGGSSHYINGYTHSGKGYDIDSCSLDELFEIDADMCPLGK